MLGADVFIEDLNSTNGTYINGKAVKTVWSYFGIAYGFVPVALPVLGLLWLRKNRSN